MKVKVTCDPTTWRARDILWHRAFPMTDVAPASAIPLTDQLSPHVCRPQCPAHRQRGGRTRQSRLPGSSVLRLRVPAQGLAVRYAPTAHPTRRGRAVPALATVCPWARALGCWGRLSLFVNDRLQSLLGLSGLWFVLTKRV